MGEVLPLVLLHFVEGLAMYADVTDLDCHLLDLGHEFIFIHSSNFLTSSISKAGSYLFAAAVQ